MPEFSSDQPGPAARFKPGPGQLGEHAALQGTRSPGGGRAHPASPRQRQAHGGGQVRQAGREHSQGQAQEQDQRHLVYGLMHLNAQRLGRDVPFGLWALHNGYFGELAPGHQPVDWLDA